MSLIAELKRRSVFKVGVAYLVVGWLVVQAASIAMPAFDAPAWAMRTFILIVALGFPLALVLAWTFDVTPEGVKLDPTGVGTKRVFTAAAILAALAIGWFMRGGLGGGAQEFDAPLGPQSTAVLPFINMSSDKENEYFSDGLTETLLHKLAQVPELKVAARTSSFAFKDKQSDIRAIGRELGVATVVEGSVQRAGDTLRITAQLVKTADGSHIWSRNYDRKLADLFAIQDEIAIAVTEALVGALLPAEAKAAIAQGGTQDLAAYDLYTKALARRALNSFDSLKEAEALLKQAIERDPKYVDAMLAQCWNWTSMEGTGIITVDAAGQRIDQMLDRVEALEPADPGLLGLRAVRAQQRGQRDAALALFDRALAAAPQDPQLLIAYVANLDLDDPTQNVKALDLIARAAVIDPLNPRVVYRQIGVFTGLKRPDDAYAAAQRLIEIAPKSPLGYQELGGLEARKDRYADEFLNWRKSQPYDPTDHELAAELALQLDKLGDHDTADLWLAKSLAIAPGNFYPLAMQAQLASRRGDLATAYALALPLIGRHEESRRGNWNLVTLDGCVASVALGRQAEYRAALAAARMAPAGFSVKAVEAVLDDRINARHMFNHVRQFLPCLVEQGPAGEAQRVELLATIKALTGEEWMKHEGGGATLVATLTGDRATTLRSFLKAFADGMDVPRAEQAARSLALESDPAVLKVLEERRAAFVREAERLPKVLADAGMSAAP